MNNSPDKDRISKISEKFLNTDDHLQHFELVEELKESPGNDSHTRNNSFEVKIDSLIKSSKRIETERSINSANKIAGTSVLKDLKLVKI